MTVRYSSLQQQDSEEEEDVAKKHGEMYASPFKFETGEKFDYRSIFTYSDYNNLNQDPGGSSWKKHKYNKGRKGRATRDTPFPTVNQVLAPTTTTSAKSSLQSSNPEGLWVFLPLISSPFSKGVSL